MQTTEKCLLMYRTTLRQLLSDCGVPSNPGIDDVWILEKIVEKIKSKNKHELNRFEPCTFGDGGYYYHDGADRAICSCGWKSAAVQRNKTALVALWKAHCELSLNIQAV
jgi:hypothetical protein